MTKKNAVSGTTSPENRPSLRQTAISTSIYLQGFLLLVSGRVDPQQKLIAAG